MLQQRYTLLAGSLVLALLLLASTAAACGSSATANAVKPGPTKLQQAGGSR
jgi:hypothetical protein